MHDLPVYLTSLKRPLLFYLSENLSELVAKAFNNSNKSHSRKSHGNTKSSCSLTETQPKPEAEHFVTNWGVLWLRCCKEQLQVSSTLSVPDLKSLSWTRFFSGLWGAPAGAFGIYPLRHGSTRLRQGCLSLFHLWCSGSCWCRWSSTCIWLEPETQACAELLVIVVDCGTFLAVCKAKFRLQSMNAQ